MLKMTEGLEFLPYKEKVGELGLWSLENKGLREIHSQYVAFKILVQMISNKKGLGCVVLLSFTTKCGARILLHKKLNQTSDKTLYSG